jgi:hypothetical protein
MTAPLLLPVYTSESAPIWRQTNVHISHSYDGSVKLRGGDFGWKSGKSYKISPEVSKNPPERLYVRDERFGIDPDALFLGS